MTMQYSTALANRLLGGGAGEDDLKSLFANGYIVIYDGAVPDVDSVSVGNVLAVLSTEGLTPGAGNGLDLGTAAARAIPKDSDVWGVAGDFNGGAGVDNAGAAAATYYRHVQSASAASSANVITEAAVIGTTALRMQGTCGSNASFDMILVNPVLEDESNPVIATAQYYF